ncbi:MAG: RNA polymerase sigma factor [Solirubrobacterales bacterium]
MNAGIAVAERDHAAAFERDCEKLRPLGEAFVLRRFGGQLNHADAQDVVADVVIRLHQQAEQGDPPENLRATFFSSVRNAAIDQLRLRGTHPTVALEAALDLPTDGIAPSEYAESREDGAVLGEALVSMRRRYREAILLRFGVGLTVPEIAERQGIGLEGAKKLVMRATCQVKRRVLAVTSSSHCEEMQSVAKRQLFEKYVADLASEKEVAQLEKHLEHCGRCKSLVVNLHQSLHELASGLLVSTAVGDQLTDRAGVADHLARWLDSAGDSSQAAVEKARVTAFKLGNAVSGGESAAGGALGATGQKIAAVCATGAAAATCVGAGVVGPGISIGEEQPRQDPPAKVQTDADRPPGDTITKAPTDPAPSEEQQTPAEPVKPVQQVNKELGLGQSSSSGSSASGESRDFAAPAASSGSGGGSGGGGGFTFEK